MNEQESLASDQINEETASPRAVDPPTAKLLGVPDSIRYWRLVGPVWGEISIYNGPEVFLRQYRQVRPEVGHLFAAHWCRSEVHNGGFRQFFWNSTGILAPEAVEGFRAIGLLGYAELLAEAMRYFGVPYPRERVARQTRLPELPGECDPFAELNARLWGHVEWARWARAANAYARKFGA